MMKLMPLCKHSYFLARVLAEVSTTGNSVKITNSIGDVLGFRKKLFFNSTEISKGTTV